MPVMTPRQRVETALRGGSVDRVPFTMYESKIPQCTAERLMRNRGLCIVYRRAGVVRSHCPNVQVREEIFHENGKRLRRVHFLTPVGELSVLEEPAGFTSWQHEKLFKTPDDYKALLFLIQDEQFEPCYGDFLRAQEAMGEDAILRGGIALEPLQTLISGNMMDMQEFCIQWMDNRDEILKLYRAIVEKHRQLYPLVAQSPCLHFNYGGNVVPEITGPEIFEKYYLPHYNEAAEILHRHGKLLGSHFDDDCRLLAPSIAKTDLDYIEAFTPAPDTDMNLKEARAAWPDKLLWINFPSSQHHKSNEEVERLTVELVEQHGRAEGLIVGITEDMPEDRWQGSCTAIMDGLDRHARQRPGWYTSKP